MRPRLIVTLPSFVLFGRGCLAVVNQQAAAVSENGADHASLDTHQSVARSLLLRVTDWLQQVYQKYIRTLVSLPQTDTDESSLLLRARGRLIIVFQSPLVYIVGCLVGGIVLLVYGIWWSRPPPPTPPTPQEEEEEEEEETEDDLALREFLEREADRYKFQERLNDLGSRMKKCWYKLNKLKHVDDQEEKKHESELDEEVLATVVPVSQSCPLVFHNHQRHLNNLLEVVQMHGHPFVQPILEVCYSENWQRLIVVQPFVKEGSLKDLIYEVGEPTLEWSEKYAHCSKGLPPHQVAHYGRQILKAMRFLYSLGFPLLGHVQSGNIYVVNDVCKLGGYENMLLGYKTRLFRLCKDHIAQLDVILFGHLIFEMSAGYELTQLRPGVAELQAVPSSVRAILEFIFTDGFPHSVDQIAEHEFFDVPLPELESYDPASVKQLLDGDKKGLKDSMKVVLEKVHKNKPRVQKAPGMEGAGIKVRVWKHMKQFFKGKKDEHSERPVAEQASSRH